MRSPSADYLEASTLEALAADLERRGYRVMHEARLGDQYVDLLAERDGERLAFEVKARSRLRDAAQEVTRLRDAARDANLTSFRVVVAVPPHPVDVSIDGFADALASYVMWHETPPELDALASAARVSDVENVEVDAVEIVRSGIRVRGTATLGVELTDGGATGSDAPVDYASFPLSFDVSLDPDTLEIVELHALTIDTDDFDGSNPEA